MGCCGQVRTKETESISKEVNVRLLSILFESENEKQ